MGSSSKVCVGNGVDLLVRYSADDDGLTTSHCIRFPVHAVTVIFGICNALSRVGGGWITDIMAARGISRLWVLIVASVMAVVASLILATSGINGLTIGNVIMGIADGLCFAVWPLATREAFGKKVSAARDHCCREHIVTLHVSTLARRVPHVLYPATFAPTHTLFTQSYGRFYGLLNTAVGEQDLSKRALCHVNVE